MKTVLTFALLGHPVGHSVSPAIHEAAYRSFDLPHRYVLRDCPSEADVEACVQAVRRAELAGANVTVPWKRLALSLADVVEESAERVGAANVLSRDEQGRVSAANTDVGALSEVLARNVPASDGTCVVLGNGGAALAAVAAARHNGFDPVVVSARRWTGPSQDWPKTAAFERLGARPVAWAEGEGELGRLFERARAVIQATSAGMHGVGGDAALMRLIPWTRLRRDVFLYDVVYNPVTTTFLGRAAKHGYAHEGGLSMLVGQAALALHRWLGIEPPISVMRRAAEQAMFGSRA